jgi:xanthine dehydrogenase YagS FAD-binding subunit
MDKFAYASPKTVKEAVALLSSNWDEVPVLAGGTDLISLLKEHLASPKLVVNIKEIRELHGIRPGKGGGVSIGAATTLDELSENPLIRKSYPSLYEAAVGITSPQIRNMGTIGGDLCQRPRCWYYRNGYGLLAKDQSGKSLVPNGENRYHAILNNKGPAYFVSPSSFGPALIAVGAKVRVVSSSGPRDIAAEEFFVNPAKDDDREIAIKANELITEIVLPAGGSNTTYELRERQAIDWPLAAASVNLHMNGGKVSSARVVLGHVAPTPYPATGADKYLEGKTIDEKTAEEAGREALTSATPLSQNAYKVKLAQVAVKRALLQAGRKA